MSGMRDMSDQGYLKEQLGLYGLARGNLFPSGFGTRRELSS